MTLRGEWGHTWHSAVEAPEEGRVDTPSCEKSYENQAKRHQEAEKFKYMEPLGAHSNPGHPKTAVSQPALLNTVLSLLWIRIRNYCSGSGKNGKGQIN